MSKHRWFLNTKNNAWFVIDEIGSRIAKIVKQPDSEANARLIAAAPELLEFAEEWLSRQGSDVNYMTEKARAAIAKATGGNQ